MSSGQAQTPTSGQPSSSATQGLLNIAFHSSPEIKDRYRDLIGPDGLSFFPYSECAWLDLQESSDLKAQQAALGGGVEGGEKYDCSMLSVNGPYSYEQVAQENGKKDSSMNFAALLQYARTIGYVHTRALGVSFMKYLWQFPGVQSTEISREIQKLVDAQIPVTLDEYNQALAATKELMSEIELRCEKYKGANLSSGGSKSSLGTFTR